MSTGQTFEDRYLVKKSSMDAPNLFEKKSFQINSAEMI